MQIRWLLNGLVSTACVAMASLAIAQYPHPNQVPPHMRGMFPGAPTSQSTPQAPAPTANTPIEVPEPAPIPEKVKPVAVLSQDVLLPMLQKAIEKNDDDAVLGVIQQGVDVNRELPNGFLPITFAAESASLEIMKILTANDAITTEKDKFGALPIHLAAASGNTDKIKLLRAFKTPINVLDDDGVTPLYYAYLNGKLDMATYLIEEEGALVNVDDKAGTPLAFRVIAQKDDEEALKHMIDNGLNVFRRAGDGVSFLELAKRNQREKCTEIIQKIYDDRLKAYQEKLKQKNGDN